MKYPFTLLSFVICITFSCKKEDDIIFVSDCYPAHLREGVIASYSFKMGSLENETSSNSDLVNVNNAQVTEDRIGNATCAYLIDHSQEEQFLTTDNTSFLNKLDAFSISVWYQPLDTSRDGSSYEILVGRNSLLTHAHCPDRIGEWSLGLYDCRRAVFGHNNSVWMNKPILNPSSCQNIVKVLTDTWFHVVAVYDQNTYKIYINGLLQDSATGAGGCSTPNLAKDIGDLFIGKYYTGRIDDILIYDREISASEVLDLFVIAPCCQP